MACGIANLHRMVSTRPTAGVPLFLSLRGIADLARVKRPVPTTWRRRHQDFPRPVSGDQAEPLFDPREVAEWLVSTGRADPASIQADLSLYTLGTLGGTMPPQNLVAIMTALICLRYLEGDEALADGTDDVAAAIRARAASADPSDEVLLAEIADMPPDAYWLATVVDDLVEAAWGCRGAFERIMEARYRLKAAEISASALTPPLAGLIARVCGAAERAARQDGPIIVTDPAAAAGDLLTAVIDLLGHDHVPSCTAAERDPYMARLTRRRLAVHGLELSDMDVRVSEKLPDESGDPDVIVTQIPYVPGEDRSAEQILDMVGDVSVRLDRGCSAAILGPADVLFDELPPYSPPERARARLLEDSVVEAVIRLPGGLVPFRPGYETALWVLNSVPDSPWLDRILVADVSDRELSQSVIDSLAADVATWRRDGYHPDAHHRELCVQVRRSSLTGAPAPLTVRPPRNVRTIKSDAAEQLARVLTLESDLDKAGADATAVRPSVRSNAVADIHARPAAKSIGRLAREGFLTVVRSKRLDHAHVTAAGHHAVFGPDEVLGVRRPRSRMIDRAVLAASYPRAKLTRPGDVLVTVTPEFGVTIDEHGFSVAEFPVRILRITEDGHGVLTPRVLAAMLESQKGNHRPFGAIREGRRMEDHQVMVLAPETVGRLDALLAGLAARRSHAQAEIDMLDELGRLVTVGLSDGTLALTSDMT